MGNWAVPERPEAAAARPARPAKKKRRGKKRALAEASLANLRPRWQPGQSGNPSGKPQSLVEITKLARSLSPAAISTRFCTIQKRPLATR